MVRSILTVLCLSGFSPLICAQQFLPPEKIEHAGATYSMAHKNVSSNGRYVFEYTTNNETIDGWASLVTLSYSKAVVPTPLKWVESMKDSLDRENPRPHYSLYIKADHGYGRIIYEPDSKNLSYESNVQRSFHVAACGGIVVYQFAKKYLPSADQTAEGKLSALRRIAGESAKLVDEVEQSEWMPVCN